MAKQISKLPKNAVIMKCVCLKCQLKLAKTTGLKFFTPLAGKDFECEWCENVIKKFEKYAQFYKEKK